MRCFLCSLCLQLLGWRIARCTAFQFQVSEAARVVGAAGLNSCSQFRCEPHTLTEQLVAVQRWQRKTQSPACCWIGRTGGTSP